MSACIQEDCPFWSGDGNVCACALFGTPVDTSGFTGVQNVEGQEISDEAFVRRNADFLRMDWLD